jgi:hypothetical protein
VLLGIKYRVTYRTAVTTGTLWIELEECAISLASAAPSRHARLLGGNEEILVRQQAVEVRREGRRQRRQLAGDVPRPLFE